MNELRERLERAISSVDSLLESEGRTAPSSRAVLLRGKLQGLRIALSYLDEQSATVDF